MNFLLSVSGHGTEEEWELFLPGRLKTNPLGDQVDLHEENLCRPVICHKYSRAAFRETLKNNLTPISLCVLSCVR